jgi:hypothetical protein
VTDYTHTHTHTHTKAKFNPTSQWSTLTDYSPWCTLWNQCPSICVLRRTIVKSIGKTKNQWPKSASEIYQPSDHRLSAKLVPTFVDRGCCMVNTTDPYGRILGFLHRSHYFFLQVAPQLYSQGWVDPVPDPLLLRKSGSAGNRTRDLWICSQEHWPIGYRGGPWKHRLSEYEMLPDRVNSLFCKDQDCNTCGRICTSLPFFIYV